MSNSVRPDRPSLAGACAHRYLAMMNAVAGAWPTATVSHEAMFALGVVLTTSRLFLVPGMTHCSGGSGLDSFDTVSSIVAWVELSKAPTRIVATGGYEARCVSTALSIPSKAHYGGDGDAKDEKNFHCR